MSTGLTTRYSLPFPYGDDPLANGDDMIQRLAEAIDELAYQRSIQSQTVYLTAMSFPQQLVAPDVWKLPAGPYTATSDSGSTYGGITQPFPDVDTTNGLIYIPVTGLYEVEWRHTYFPSAPGVSNTNQIWVAAWRDNTGRGRDQYARGHLASEVPGTSDAAMVGGSLTVPFNAGQYVRSQCMIHGGTQSVSGFVRLCGPFGAPTSSI